MSALHKLLLKFSQEISFPLEIITERCAFVGQSGSGKTYAAMRLAELMLEAGAQIVALDPMGVWWGLLSTADGKASGFSVYVFGGPHAHVPIGPESGALVAEVIVQRQISAVIDISLFTRGEQVQFAIGFAEKFFKLQVEVKRPVHVFLEECQTFMPQVLPPERGGDAKKNPAVMLNRFEMLARQGRSQGVGCSMITQAPQAVAKSCLNQAGTLIAMRTMGKHERKAVGDWMADKASDDSQLKLDQLLPKLNTGEAWIASPNLLGLYVHTKVSKKTTFDSSSTPKFGAKVVEPKVLASVDLEQIKVTMAETIAAATADDPKPLRKRIAELERQLAAKPTAAPAPKAEVKTVEKPVLTEAELKRFEVAAEILSAQANIVLNALKPVADAMYVVKASLGRPPPTFLDRPAVRRALDPASPPMPRRQPVKIPGTDQALSKGERVVLTAAAQHSAGVDRTQLTVLTGYKRSTRDKFLQLLSSAGFIESHGLTIVATAAGIAALGSDFEPLPTGAELRAHWLARLPGGERAILELLVEAFPDQLTRPAIEEATGYKRSTRDKFIQLLAARKLIEADNSGVRASAELFS